MCQRFISVYAGAKSKMLPVVWRENYWRAKIMGENGFEKIRKLSDELRDKRLRCGHCCRCWVHTDCKCYIFGKSYPGPAKCVYYLKKELKRRQNGLQTDSGKD